MAQSTSMPVPASSIAADWINGNARDGQYNKRRVDVTNKASATDINELRFVAEVLLDHTHTIPDPPSATYSIGGSGYYILPGGLIMQWGHLPHRSRGIHTHSFPMTFPSSAFVCLCTTEAAFSDGHDGHTISGTIISSSQFKVTHDSETGIYFLALGR